MYDMPCARYCLLAALTHITHTSLFAFFFLRRFLFFINSPFTPILPPPHHRVGGNRDDHYAKGDLSNMAVWQDVLPAKFFELHYKARQTTAQNYNRLEGPEPMVTL
jgi:hypothetical protein